MKANVNIIVYLFTLKAPIATYNPYRKGTVFHESRGKHYFDGGFSEGDVLGVMIDLHDKNPVSQFPPTYKDKVTFLSTVNVTVHRL